MKESCQICNTNSLIFKHKYFSFPIKKCIKCGFIQSIQIPTNSELKNYYKTYSYNNSHGIDPITKRRYIKILERLEEYRENNLLLDFGCGQGHFLETALEKRWKVFGVEYSEMAKDIISKKGLNALEPQDFSGYNNKFDVVLCIEVIEHVNNPMETIDFLYNLLRPGGCLYLTTPNINNLSLSFLSNKEIFICYPEHLNYFNVKSLKKLLENKFLKLNFKTTGFTPNIKKRSKEAEKNLMEEVDFYKNYIEERSYLRLIKSVLNFLLNLFKKGDTIKVYAIKRQDN